MARYHLIPIVEGHGEVQALPILIRGWLKSRRFTNVSVGPPVRAAGSGALKARHDATEDLGIEHYVSIALASQRTPDALFVLLDADEGCPKKVGEELLRRARNVLPEGFPVGVVLANREYEAWFLAALGSPRFRRSLVENGICDTPPVASSVKDAESISDCKKRVAELILREKYQETIHQKTLTELLPFTQAVALRSRSFRKLLKELSEVLQAARRRRPL